MNLRPSGYEPDELPGCSTPRHHVGLFLSARQFFVCPFRRCRPGRRAAPPRVTVALACSIAGTRRGPRGYFPWPSLSFVIVMGFFSGVCAPASMPGDVLLFRGLSHSTIGAVRFHGRVRDGIGWVTDAMVTKQWSRRMNARGF